jgi:predicted aspartyl protease
MPQYDSADHDPPAPVATVTLRALDGASAVPDVCLLIDTGADATLLPRDAVERLGLRPDPALRYELIGFDGSRTSAQAVDLDVLFARKAFRGRYLVTDEPRGILGRDVLNSLVLLFDGPAKQWSQPAAPP